MSGYIGRGQPVAVSDNSVETADILDGAVTDAKLNSTKLNAIADNANNYVKPSNEPISYITGLQTAINAKVSSETGKSLITDTVLATLLSDVGALESLVTSDESTLDTLQEIVDFIEANKSTLDALGISSIAGLSSALAGKVMYLQAQYSRILYIVNHQLNQLATLQIYRQSWMILKH